MPKYLFDQGKTKNRLKRLFKRQKVDLNSFGSTVNQTFEAKVFAKTILWYKSRKWKVKIKNPISGINKNKFKLKFTTNGEPGNFSYARCSKNKSYIQIRHQLRIATKASSFKKDALKTKGSANICCDVAVIRDMNLDEYKTFYAVPNQCLLSFAEAKHMSGYAELLAGFIGMVYELKPNKLKRIRTKKYKEGEHIPPFLYVSGKLFYTGEGVYNTILKRGFDIDVYTFYKPL